MNTNSTGLSTSNAKHSTHDEQRAWLSRYSWEFDGGETVAILVGSKPHAHRARYTWTASLVVWPEALEEPQVEAFSPEFRRQHDALAWLDAQVRAL